MHSKEHLLCQVLYAVPIGDRTGNHAEYQAFVLIDQLSEPRLAAGAAALNQLAVELKIAPL